MSMAGSAASSHALVLLVSACQASWIDMRKKHSFNQVGLLSLIMEACLGGYQPTAFAPYMHFYYQQTHCVCTKSDGCLHAGDAEQEAASELSEQVSKLRSELARNKQNLLEAEAEVSRLQSLSSSKTSRLALQLQNLEVPLRQDIADVGLQLRSCLVLYHIRAPDIPLSLLLFENCVPYKF